MTLSRRERQREANRESILEAALNIAEREGWAAVTIRRIATEIDYTSPIIYQHFANKDAALKVLLQRGYDDLCEAMARATKKSTPDERPLQLGLAYLRFARDNPRRYELMNGLGVTLNGEVRRTAAQGVSMLTTEVLTVWAAHRNIRLQNPDIACETAWGVIHGMASLGMLKDIGFDRAERLASDAIYALLKHWETS